MEAGLGWGGEVTSNRLMREPNFANGHIVHGFSFSREIVKWGNRVAHFQLKIS